MSNNLTYESSSSVGQIAAAMILEAQQISNLTNKFVNLSFVLGNNGGLVYANLASPSYPRTGEKFTQVQIPNIIMQPILQPSVGFQISDIEIAYVSAFIPHIFLGYVKNNLTTIEAIKAASTLRLPNGRPFLRIGGSATSAARILANQLLQYLRAEIPDAALEYVSFTNGNTDAALLGGNITHSITPNMGKVTDATPAIFIASQWPLVQFPDVPTFVQYGYNIVNGNYLGTAVPRGTPEDVIANISSLLDQIHRKPTVYQNLQANNLVPMFVTRASVPAFMQAQIDLVNAYLNLETPVFETALLSDAVGVVFQVLSYLSCLWVSVLAVLIFQYRSSRTLIACSPPLLMLVLIGSGCLSVASVLMSLSPSSTYCSATVWLVNLGIGIITSVLLLKLYRLYQIFNSKKLTSRRAITQFTLVLSVLAILLIPTAILLAYELRSPPSVDSLYRCRSSSSSSTLSYAYGWALIAIHGVLFSMTALISSKLLDIPKTFLKEAHFISLFSRCMLVLGVIWTSVEFISQSLSPLSERIFNLIFLLVGVYGCHLLLYLPIVLQAIHERRDLAKGGDKSMIGEDFGSVDFSGLTTSLSFHNTNNNNIRNSQTKSRSSFKGKNGLGENGWLQLLMNQLSDLGIILSEARKARMTKLCQLQISTKNRLLESMSKLKFALRKVDSIKKETQALRDKTSLVELEINFTAGTTLDLSVLDDNCIRIASPTSPTKSSSLQAAGSENKGIQLAVNNNNNKNDDNYNHSRRSSTMAVVPDTNLPIQSRKPSSHGWLSMSSGVTETSSVSHHDAPALALTLVNLTVTATSDSGIANTQSPSPFDNANVHSSPAPLSSVAASESSSSSSSSSPSPETAQRDLSTKNYI